jgi:hypothetical protein
MRAEDQGVRDMGDLLIPNLGDPLPATHPPSGGSLMAHSGHVYDT